MKAFKWFFRDFLGMEDIVSTFRFPARTINPRLVPSKMEIKEFYGALKSTAAKILFLFYASSVGRKSEVWNLYFEEIDQSKLMIIPKKKASNSKNTWVTFYKARNN